MTLIRQFADGTRLTFGRGRFDDWCVLLTNAQVRNYALRDTEYFARLRELGARYDAARLYHDFVRVYDATDAQLRPQVHQLISEIAAAYPDGDRLRVEILLSILYATMVAEENKRKAILKKRIKRLAVHQILLEGATVATATTFSRGRRWYELEAECRRRGF